MEKAIEHHHRLCASYIALLDSGCRGGFTRKLKLRVNPACTVDAPPNDPSVCWKRSGKLRQNSGLAPKLSLGGMGQCCAWLVTSPELGIRYFLFYTVYHRADTNIPIFLEVLFEFH